MPKKIPVVFLFLLAFISTATAQFSGFTHEIGIIAGPISFRSDYGERNNPETISKNMGYSIGIVHYLNFTNFTSFSWNARESYFSEHFRVRSELSFCKASLEHFGKWVDPSLTSVTSNQLRAMKGSTSLINLGVQLEYYPLGISDFSSNIGAFSPFVSFGTQYSFCSPEIHSSLGPLDTPISTPTKYFNATSNQSIKVPSLVGGMGTRYKYTDYSDLLLEIRWQYYFSDWVDGLNPNQAKYPENKFNDWNIWFNFGYIYYLE